MRKKIVAGNWKMNKSFPEVVSFISEISASKYDEDVELVLIPPYLYVLEIMNRLKSNIPIKVGVQNCSEHNNGAFTGEISAEMIKSVNASYVIIGHSERREYFNEKNQLLSSKVDQALNNELNPIYCCGEQLVEREDKNHFEVIKTQITESLFHLTSHQISQCIIAYEPVWAIGTGVTASTEQAQEMHLFIRNLIAQQYGETTAQNIAILYGGSCKPSNAKELFSQPDIDGGLIGGASLKVKDFIAIANSF